MKRKLGVIVQYFHQRDDLPPLLDALSDHWELVLFAKPEEIRRIDCNFEIRPISNSPTLWNRLWTFAYEALGNIPGSRRNFKFWNLRRIAQQTNIWKRKRQRTFLAIRQVFANTISFDFYLSKLQLVATASIDDIDIFLATTDIYDINFFNHAVRSNKPVFIYVYSWDHAGKYCRYPRRIAGYLTWNSHISEDVRELHRVPSDVFLELGSTQLAIVAEYKSRSPISKRLVEHRYVYYAATMGYPEAVEQEIRVIQWLASTLLAIAPDITLRIRPYPNAKVFRPYRSLTKLKNVEIENAVISEDSVVFQRDSIDEKYKKIEDAELFIHMGSTIGLEASYFNTPVIHLAPSDFDYGYPLNSHCHLRHTLDQRHLQRYMLSVDFPNVVKLSGQLETVLTMGIREPESLLNYNRLLSGMTPLKSFGELGSELTRLIEFRCQQINKGTASQN